jgi:hypothetical protein
VISICPIVLTGIVSVACGQAGLQFMIAVSRTTSGLPLMRSSSMYIISRRVDGIDRLESSSNQGGVFGETPPIIVHTVGAAYEQHACACGLKAREC